MEYPDQLKQLENNKKWKEFTNLKPGTYMTYKGRQYGEKDQHKLMKAIIAHMKSYNNEQDGLPSMCFFAKKNIKSGLEFTFDYNWDWVSGQV